MSLCARAAELPRGVRALDEQDASVLVHGYQGGVYRLRDIADFFRLGEVACKDDIGTTRLVLTDAETRELKVMADAYSFDHDPAFIEMCLELHRFAQRRPRERHVFVADF